MYNCICTSWITRGTKDFLCTKAKWKIFHLMYVVYTKCKFISSYSLMFSAGWQLIFIDRQNVLNWASSQEKLSSRLSNQVGKITFTASQFAWCPTINETAVTTTVVHFCTQGQIHVQSLILLKQKLLQFLQHKSPNYSPSKWFLTPH